MAILTICLVVVVVSFIVGAYFAGRILERRDDRLELGDHVAGEPHRRVAVVLRRRPG